MDPTVDNKLVLEPTIGNDFQSIELEFIKEVEEEEELANEWEELQNLAPKS